MCSSSAQSLASDWRSSDSLRARRLIAGASLLSSAILGTIGLFQIGVLRRLPTLPRKAFRPDEIHSSPMGYELLKTPDALLGVASYSATACLAAMAGERRAELCPAIPLAMGAKLLVDAAFAGQLTAKSWRRFHALSPWSLAVTVTSFAALGIAAPELKASWRSIRRS
jgi:hypothetical protein